MNLSRMRDIGGCRIVTKTQSNVYAIADYIKTQTSMQVVEERDYIKEPRQSGYRALHLVVERDRMPIEVQIRSEPMHEWAQNVEHFSGLLGANFKQDGGDTPFEVLMRFQSELQGRVENGYAVTEAERVQDAALTEAFLDWCIKNWS